MHLSTCLYGNQTHYQPHPLILNPQFRHTLTLAGLCMVCSPIGTKVGALGLNPLGGWGGLLVGEPFSGERLGCTGLEDFWPCLDSSGAWWRPPGHVSGDRT